MSKTRTARCLWAKKGKRQPGMTGVLLGAYVVLLSMLAEGMDRTLLHPGSLSRNTWGSRRRTRQRFCFAEAVASLRPGGLRAVHDDAASARCCPG